MTPNLPRVRIGLPTLCLAFLRVFTLIAMFGGTALAMGAGSGQGAAARGSDASGEPRPSRGDGQNDPTDCPKGNVWDARNRRCAAEQNGVPSDSERTGYQDATAIPRPRLPEEIRSQEDRIDARSHSNADARKNASLARA
jgi:hypothetical protein